MKERYSEKAYNELIEDLFSRHQSFQTAGSKAYKPGLARVLQYDARHGKPHGKYPCIHIAGTNGKGSTAHFLASILQKAGLRTGLYTSPHIIDFTERARIIEKDECLTIPKKWVFNYL